MPTPTYHALREQLEQLLVEGRVSHKQAAEWGKVETYWHLGDALHAHLEGQPRAEYGQQVVLDLSSDLGLSQSLLWDLLRFRRCLPTLATYGELGWSHIRETLSLPSQDQRRFYLQAANQHHWSVRQLREAIQTDHFGGVTDAPLAVSDDDDAAAAVPLLPRLGSLYTYRVRSTPEGRRCLDLGFHIHWSPPIPALRQCDAGAIVTIPPDTDMLVPRRSGTRMWTYVAQVERVIDGDSFVATVHPGFDHFLPGQRIRLNGIDCPELYTLAGRTARDFVRHALDAVDFVVLTTFRTDTYGRYLADVLYLPGTSDPLVVRRKGIYLNRQLLDERLARRYLR